VPRPAKRLLRPSGLRGVGTCPASVARWTQLRRTHTAGSERPSGAADDSARRHSARSPRQRAAALLGPQPLRPGRKGHSAHPAARRRQDLSGPALRHRGAAPLLLHLRNGIEGLKWLHQVWQLEGLADPSRRRVRGHAAQTLLVRFVLAASNLRRIRAFRAYAVVTTAPSGAYACDAARSRH